ncbi:hypothetical protein QJS10_CPA03g00181 [Acorus calamus]|uniref:Uncharacterized protein n=1 Tax=Acorus calamus TaxID=4465 RepID=A0AAV9F9B6_ACOCL|nr:hypothetical protein QJS10_CPA03g00181 [Acorus calamus]
MKRRISSNEEALLGRIQDDKAAHIMVMVGKEALCDEALIGDLLKAGATVIQINCAHDDARI